MKRFLFLSIWILIFSTWADALPSFDEVKKAYVKSDSLLLDRNGEVIHELRIGKIGRRLDWTPLKAISPALQEAVIQAEDRRFYDHGGVDYRSMAAALVQGLTSESLRGASTISMQLASLLDQRLQSKKGKKSFWQKKDQVLNAWDIEKDWSKTEVLEAYLNLITFRGEVQGIAAASRALFGKDPHGLDQSDSLILASLIRSPNAPFAEVVKRALTLNQWMKWPVDEQAVHIKVRQIFFGTNFLRPQMSLAPHVARQLLQGLADGSTLACTLDRRVQQFVIDRLNHHLLSLKSQNVKDGAVLVVENKTGEVLAYVSHSGEPYQRRYVDGVQAKRQAGSALKPFLYALAFDRHILTPASILEDTPLDIAVFSGIYQPKNYDSQFKGLVTSRVALGSSLNVPAVKTLSLVGIDDFLTKLRQLGIKGLNESGDFYGPSLALGSADVSLWELVNAYRTLANEGMSSELRLLFNGGTSSKPQQIFSKEAAFLISDILSDRDARSMTFGLENPLATRFWTAVKTGTSKDMRDNWCIGYSRKYTVGVWVGNFSGEQMWNVSGITGAAPLWIEIMQLLHRQDGLLKKEPPAHLVSKEIQFSQGLESFKKEWFIQGTEPDRKEKKVGQLNYRILYPPSGTVIALDPDIPEDLQKIFFIALLPGRQGAEKEGGVRWVLNGTPMGGFEKVISWCPEAGQQLLTLVDQEGKILDQVEFEVRGIEETVDQRENKEGGWMNN